MLTRPSWWLDQADVCWRAPIPRQKLVDALGRMIWQPGEDVGEPGLRIYIVELRGRAATNVSRPALAATFAYTSIAFAMLSGTSAGVADRFEKSTSYA